MGFFNRTPGGGMPSRSQTAPGGMQQGQQGDPMAMLRQLAADPSRFGEVWNLPKGMTDEKQIMDYVVQTGQVNPALLQNPMVMAAARKLAAFLK